MQIILFFIFKNYFCNSKNSISLQNWKYKKLFKFTVLFLAQQPTGALITGSQQMKLVTLPHYFSHIFWALFLKKKNYFYISKWVKSLKVPVCLQWKCFTDTHSLLIWLNGLIGRLVVTKRKVDYCLSHFLGSKWKSRDWHSSVESRLLQISLLKIPEKSVWAKELN